MPPDWGLSNKQGSGIKGKKLRLTYLFVANADGSKKLAPLIIGKANKPHAFKNKTGEELGFNYQQNAKVWMTGKLYQEWLLDWDQQLARDGQQVLLLHDNFAGHVVPASLTNIHVKPFKSNLTAHVQPNDQGIIHCFKAHYCAIFVQHTINCYDAGITPAEIYDINQLNAMRLANQAWNEVDATTIQNCWQKAGILPDMDPSPPIQPSVPISALIHTMETHDNSIAWAETLVQGVLDDLEKTGALQPLNWMSITEFLNPAAEMHDLVEATENDIYEAVMDAKRVKDGLDADDDDLEKDVASAKPGPTHCEALQAVLTLQEYIGAIDDPFVCKLEVMLNLFGWMTQAAVAQSMKDTKLMDYFDHKQ